MPDCTIYVSWTVQDALSWKNKNKKKGAKHVKHVRETRKTNGPSWQEKVATET